MQNRDCWVYVATDGSGRHKIGHTKDLKLRMYHLGRDLGFKPVRLVHSEKLDEAAPEVENLAHWSLQDAKNHREWFDVPAETAIAAVTSAAERHRAGERQDARFAVVKRFAVRDDLRHQMDAALEPGETRQRFTESAIERELERRGR